MQETGSSSASSSSLSKKTVGSIQKPDIYMHRQAKLPQQSKMINNTPQYIPEEQCNTMEQMVQVLIWMVQSIKQLNFSHNYHPCLTILYLPDKNVIPQLVKNSQNYLKGVQEVVHINYVLEQILTKNAQFNDQQVHQFIYYQKCQRNHECHPQSLKLLARMENVLLKNYRTKQSKIKITEDFISLFQQFMVIEHYHQVEVFFELVNQTTRFEVINFVSVDDIQNIIKLGSMPPLDQWPILLEDILLDLNGLNDKLKAMSSSQSEMLSFGSDNSSVINPHLLDKQFYNINSLRYKVASQELISDYRTIGKQINCLHQTEQSQRQQTIILTLKQLHHFQIMEKIHKSQQLEHILKPNKINKNVNGQGCIKQFEFYLPKGENIYSAYYLKNKQVVNQTLLWQSSRELIYSFIISVDKACQEVQKLGIHYADFKMSNLVKFGYKFSLIDFDFAYLIPQENDIMRGEFKIIRNIIRVMLLGRFPSRRAHDESYFLFKGKEKVFKNLKQAFKQEMNQIVSQKQKLLKVEEYEMKSIKLLNNLWEESHIEQIKKLITNLLNYQQQCMPEPYLMRRQQKQMILRSFSSSFSRLYHQTQRHDNFLRELGLIYSQFSSTSQYNLRGIKMPSLCLNQLLHKTQNKSFQLPLSKQTLWSKKKPRLIYTFLEKLSLYINKINKQGIVDKQLTIHSFIPFGESFLYAGLELNNDLFALRGTSDWVKRQNYQTYVKIIKQILNYGEHPISNHFDKDEQQFLLKTLTKLTKWDIINITNYLQESYKRYKIFKAKVSQLSYKL